MHSNSAWSKSLKPTTVVVVVLACIFPVLAQSGKPETPRGQHRVGHMNARLLRNSRHANADIGPPDSDTPNPFMNYYGGPVISNVNVEVVFWGENVDPSIQSGIPPFYQAITNSSFLDLLGEYSTIGMIADAGLDLGESGSNQSINRGLLGGSVVIHPNNSSTTLSDLDVQTEIQGQITAGVLPAPLLDSSGNTNTLYMVYFPPGITIALDQFDVSCQQFCSYHGTFSWHSLSTLYGVVPDHGAGSGCDVGCGKGTQLQVVTLNSSHELAEAVTDADVGIVADYAKPLGWYSQQQIANGGGDFGEVGDVCNQQPGTVSGYTVQLVWSNAQNSCSDGPAQIHLNAPATATAGAPFNVTVTAQNAAGTTIPTYKRAVHFSVPGDPSATVPPDYIFTGKENGTLNVSFTLSASGNQVINAVDTRTPTINGVTTVSVGGGVPAQVLDYRVLFGHSAYSVTSSSRNRLPWPISGIQIVFSKPIANGDSNSLSGVAATSLAGLGTNTLTWTINPVSLGSVATALVTSGSDALKDATGTTVATSTQSFRVLYADFNDDGAVSSADLVGVNNARSAPYNIFADVNGDGIVDLTDVQIVRSRIGTTLP